MKEDTPTSEHVVTAELQNHLQCKGSWQGHSKYSPVLIPQND